jgi:hypothetical protein
VDALARSLVIAGIVLVLLGILLYASPSLPLLGKLPGDLRIERPGLRVYLPVTSCILISLALSGAVWLFSRLR